MGLTQLTFLNAQTNNKQSKKTKFQAEKVKIVQNV